MVEFRNQMGAAGALSQWTYIPEVATRFNAMSNETKTPDDITAVYYVLDRSKMKILRIQFSALSAYWPGHYRQGEDGFKDFLADIRQCEEKK